jgi:hypothetical protein
MKAYLCYRRFFDHTENLSIHRTLEGAEKANVEHKAVWQEFIDLRQEKWPGIDQSSEIKYTSWEIEEFEFRP